jgi:F0F1-type ATP synthase membrane subunit b/b'
MNIQCNQIDDLLLEGDAFSMQMAARHAQGCPTCLEKLTAWNEISETAEGMQASWNSDLLWPRIERALKAERRSSFPAQWLRIAAVILLTVGIAATTLFVVREGAREARFDAKIIIAGELDEADRAQEQHEAAIARLEKLAEGKLEEAEAPVMISYKEKLMLLDDAIAECQTNIERNRQNAHVRKQLLAMYSEKQRTLRDVLREGTHVSTP